jgi:hypothetical protein|tara:strand:- start:1559 stop:1846 length:288 start_codon:yes stop_codon:yes gene_type:complete
MKKNSNLQLNIGNEKLYFDVDEFMGNITYITGDTVDKATEINLPKFEFFKSMVDTICNIVEDVDDKLGVVSLNKLSIPNKLALNTLIKYKIIKKL